STMDKMSPPAHDYKGGPVLWTLADQVQSGNAALLVIDMQKDFVASDGLIGRRGRDMTPLQRIVPKINKLVGSARNAQVPVIWVRTTHRLADSPPPYAALYLPAGRQGEWDEQELPVFEGSPGAEWYAEMD